MSKSKVMRIIFSIVLILLIVASVAFYVADIVLNNTSATDNLFKMLAAVIICLSALIRLFYAKAKRRRNLAFYQSEYADFVNQAFLNSPFHKKKLLCAIRLYNEDNLTKALKYLGQLKPVCKTKNDAYAVGLFIGLVLTDMNLPKEAIDVYQQLLDLNIATSTIYGNLGSIHSGLGNYSDAITYSRLAIQNDEKNPAPYNNLAKLYFDNFDFDNAKRYALEALNINHKFRPSASLLAIIYSLEEDRSNEEKYSHIAISSGENPQRLKNAIEYYKTLRSDNDDPNNDSDTEKSEDDEDQD